MLTMMTMMMVGKMIEPERRYPWICESRYVSHKDYILYIQMGMATRIDWWREGNLEYTHHRLAMQYYIRGLERRGVDRRKIDEIIGYHWLLEYWWWIETGHWKWRHG